MSTVPNSETMFHDTEHAIRNRFQPHLVYDTHPTKNLFDYSEVHQNSSPCLPLNEHKWVLCLLDCSAPLPSLRSYSRNSLIFVSNLLLSIELSYLSSNNESSGTSCFHSQSPAKHRNQDFGTKTAA